MADISKITLPSGNTYDIKDAVARDKIATLSGAMTYIGETTTELTDGCTTSPITISGKSVTPKSGDVVIYGNCEFIWSDISSSWSEFGSTGSLKSLAFKDNASTSYTPAGSVTSPTVNVAVNTEMVPTMSVTVSDETLSIDCTKVTVVTGIKSATATAPKFTGTAATITVK